MAEEASKVLTGTTSKVLSNIERAQNLVTDSVAKRVRQAEASANMMLGNVSDMTNLRRKRPSVSSLDRGLHSNIQFSHNFSSNYELDMTDIDDHVSPTPSSEDVSKSRETICSTPTKTHDSVSDEEISFDMEHFNNKLDEARMEMKNMSDNKAELQRRSSKVFEKRSLKSLLWVRNLYQSSTTLGLEPVSIVHYTRPGSSIKRPTSN